MKFFLHFNKITKILLVSKLNNFFYASKMLKLFTDDYSFEVEEQKLIDSCQMFKLAKNGKFKKEINYDFSIFPNPKFQAATLHIKFRNHLPI